MLPDLADTLPLAHRLALSYAPAAVRKANLALLLLDSRLRSIVAGGGEPAIAQIKLAWWRERLSEPRARWPEGEPLLGLLREWPGDPAPLANMADGWEMLLADTLDQQTIAQYAEGRARGWEALGGQNAGLTARRWALADLLLHLSPGAEADAVQAALAKEPPASPVPRNVRPLGVLHGLAMRAIRRQSAELLDGPGAMLTALRFGVLGR